MYVKLESYTKDPEITCAKGMLGCRSALPSSKINITLDEAREKMSNARRMKHYGCFEGAVFIFSVEGVSRALTHQLVRHRIASFLQQSQRTVNMGTPSYVTPPTISENPKAKKEFDKMMKNIWKMYSKLSDDYHIPPEDARFVLPNACTTNIQITMNARSLCHFFKLRLDKHAQWEIRAMAEKMYDEVMIKAPSIFEDIPDDI